MTSFFVISQNVVFITPSWKHQRRSDDEVKKAELETALDEAILSKGTAELASIYLIDRYEFDVDALKARLAGMQFESSSLHGIF